MKIVLKVLGLLVVVISLFLGSLGVFRNFRDAKDAKEYQVLMADSQKQLDEYRKQSEQLEGYEKESMLEIIKSGEEAMIEIPSPGVFNTVGILMAVLTLISVIAAVFLFVIKPKVANMLFITAILISVIAIFVSPDIDGGMSGGISNRKLSMIVAAGAFLSTLFPFLLARSKK